MKRMPREFHAVQGGTEGGEKEEGEEEEARCEWDFSLTTVVSSNATVEVSDTLGVIEFDPSDQFLATGGIARKIRVYNLKSLLPAEPPSQALLHPNLLSHANACDYYICTPAKLSSLRWRPDIAGGLLGSGDYDGVVTEYDLNRRIAVFERDEHGGRRVWSIDYSHGAIAIGASGSDDGTAQLWDTRCSASASVAVLRPGSPVCCVEFCPAGGPVIAVGSANRLAYIYDVRMTAAPLTVFAGHRRTVSYVRFLGEREIVTAATDGCLKLWDTAGGRVKRTYEGHVNGRSFVGLSVWRRGGLVGCGSESNEVFVYDSRWGEPIWVKGFGPTPASSSRAVGNMSDDRQFVSSVCWRQGEAGEEQCTLVAGGSDGNLQVFVGTKKAMS